VLGRAFLFLAFGLFECCESAGVARHGVPSVRRPAQ
jgi:hypothetical protein